MKLMAMDLNMSLDYRNNNKKIYTTAHVDIYVMTQVI